MLFFFSKIHIKKANCCTDFFRSCVRFLFMFSDMFGVLCMMLLTLHCDVEFVVVSISNLGIGINFDVLTLVPILVKIFMA